MQDAENVHNKILTLGSYLGSKPIGRILTKKLFSYSNPSLEQNINGVLYKNPIGLAAGFDYNGYVAGILKSTGFGFNTVGTVTAKPYEGNKRPRLKRLIKSKSLLVNKGFKSDGADIVEKRLNSMNTSKTTLGVSIGSTNIPQVNTLPIIINDYLYTFDKFKNKDYVKYFELNISCPNLKISSSELNNPTVFENLVKAISSLNIQKPIYVKMANELDLKTSIQLVEIGINHKMSGFIFSNLVKNRDNKFLDKSELATVKDLKGNFSGKPCDRNANRLIREVYKNFGNDTTIIGCGGVFSAQDAYDKIKQGASLVQLITGMIFEGPQLAGEINEGITKLLKKDGFKNISEAIGTNL